MKTFTASIFHLAIGIVLAKTMGCAKKTQPKPSVQGTDTTTNASKSFTVKGTSILDPAGNNFVAKGVNVNGPYWPWDRSTIPDIPLITDTWKFNAVRVNCWPEFSIYNSNNTDLDGIVQGLTAKKVVVVLEEHNFTSTYPAGADLTRLTSWWLDIANKYKNNPYVWFNIMNEPGQIVVDWLNVHESIIKAIRGTGANNIIVLDESGSGQAGGDADDNMSGVLTYGQTLVSKYKNLVFSLHTYDSWIYSDNRLKSYIDKVHAKNLALIVGEYGTGNDYSSDVATCVFKNVIPAGVGRFAWQWTGVDKHQLTTSNGGGGWSIDNTSGTKPGNLSFVGNLVWDDNHSGIDINGAEMTPPAVLTANLDFEDDAPQNGSAISNGWINFGTSVIDATPANVHQGSYAAKVPSGAAGGFGQQIYLQPNTTYTISGWGKHSTIPGSVSSIGVKYEAVFNGPDTQLVSLDFTNLAYEQKTATFTTPATMAEAFLFVYKNDAAADLWIDDIKITKQ